MTYLQIMQLFDAEISSSIGMVMHKRRNATCNTFQ